MRTFAATSLVLLLAAPAAAQQAAPVPQPAGMQQEELLDRVVAVVGDTVLLYSDVRLELERYQAGGQPLPQSPAEMDQLVRRIVEQRVDDLVLLQAARRAGVVVDPAEVSNTVERQIAEVRGRFPSEEAFTTALNQSGRSMESYRRELTDQVASETLLRRYLSQQVGRRALPFVSDAELSAAFEEQRASFTEPRPANVSFQQAVIQPQATDSAKAEALRRMRAVQEELRGGADFEVLARRHSEDGSREQGGDLGWFREGMMVRPFEAAVYAMRPGDVSPIVETEFGYHLIKLERVRGPERQARHILIRPVVTPDDVARARTRADSVANAVRQGASLVSLAERYSTPSTQRVVTSARMDRLQEPYTSALQNALTGDVLGPLQLTGAAAGINGTAFAVLRVTARQNAGPVELADVADRLRSQLQEQRLIEQLLAEQRNATYVRVDL